MLFISARLRLLFARSGDFYPKEEPPNEVDLIRPSLPKVDTPADSFLAFYSRHEKLSLFPDELIGLDSPLLEPSTVLPYMIGVPAILNVRHES